MNPGFEWSDPYCTTTGWDTEPTLYSHSYIEFKMCKNIVKKFGSFECVKLLNLLCFKHNLLREICGLQLPVPNLENLNKVWRGFEVVKFGLHLGLLLTHQHALQARMVRESSWN